MALFWLSDEAWTAIEPGVPTLVEARTLVERFHAQAETINRPAALDRRRSRKPGRIVRQRGCTRHRRSPRRDRQHLVQRTDRRSDHQAQARQTTDVRARKDRPPRSQADRCTMISTIIKCASEPFLARRSTSRIDGHR